MELPCPAGVRIGALSRDPWITKRLRAILPLPVARGAAEMGLRTWIAGAALLMLPCAASADGLFPFDEWEPKVAAAPKAADHAQIGPDQRVLDLAVSPVGPEAIALVSAPGGRQALLRWRIGSGQGGVTTTQVPAGTKLNSLAWHPKGTSIFAAGANGLFAIETTAFAWPAKPLWKASAPIERLVVGPRPFSPGFRLFFAQRQAKGRSIASVDEKGLGYYLVTAETPPAIPAGEEDVAPFTEALSDAVPIGFHPAGDLFLIGDRQGCLRRKLYSTDNWRESEPWGERCGGHVAYAPNGAALIRWYPGEPGIEIADLVAQTRDKQLAEENFITPPRMTADGRGVVGLVRVDGGRVEFRYRPVQLPLADVVNAWQFLETPADQRRLAEHGGLFRPIAIDQLYKLYDTESYTCGQYDYRVPTRPYLVTTDIFWEVYGAAYQGIFMAVERHRAVDAFKAMVTRASEELAATEPEGRLAKAFIAARAVMSGATDGEAGLILADPEFAPRGHYTKDPAMKAYFSAVRFLARLELDEGDAGRIRTLSPEVAGLARHWIASYEGFIAPSRADLAWAGGGERVGYASRIPANKALFPLSWGWDNEIFDRSVHHLDRPMTGPKGPRLIPMGLDIAMVLGSPLAENILSEVGQFKDFPDLRARLLETREQFERGAGSDGDSIYARWMRALAVQWSGNVEAPVKGALWDAKRLQTGLASWATLRHATVLVNDLAAAECGEAGFEAIVMRPPRGYVEPDPATFKAIAGLFDTTTALVRRMWPQDTPLAKGIVRRLQQSRDQALQFASIADKEVRAEPLSARDYADIHYVGRAAEHNFLVFFSLNAEENALSSPDPIMKVAEVAGSRQTGWLQAAVGKPLEWDLIAPSFGRRELVKGAVYSYHEFTSSKPMNDGEWVRRVAQEPHPTWVQSFLSDQILSCPPSRP